MLELESKRTLLESWSKWQSFSGWGYVGKISDDGSGVSKFSYSQFAVSIIFSVGVGVNFFN